MTATLTMIDSIHADVGNIPLTTLKVAGYVTGTPEIQWLPADWARFPKASRVRIDQSAGGNAFAAGFAEVLDIEKGAATNADAVRAIPERQRRGEYSTIYVSDGSLAALRDELAADHSIKMNQVGFWVANWNLNEAEAANALGNEIVAIQWASPTSNPNTRVPGSNLTIREANVDLSVTLATWYPVPADPPAWQKTALNLATEGQAVMQELVALLEKHQ